MTQYLISSLNRVAVCFSASTINDFVPQWTDLEHYHHWKGWDKFEAGEADKLAEKACKAVGTYPLKTQVRKKAFEKKHEMKENSIMMWLKKEK